MAVVWFAAGFGTTFVIAAVVVVVTLIRNPLIK